MNTQLFRNLGLEDLVEEEKIVGEANLDGTNSVEDGLLDVEEAQGEAIKDQQQTEDLVQDIDGLENVSQALETASMEGLVSRDALNFVKIHCDTINRRWGVEVLPSASMEAFDKDDAQAVKISMEGIGETMKTMWKALIAKLKKMWTSFRNWLVKVFDVCPRIKERAMQLKRRSVDVKFPSNVVLPEKYKGDYRLTLHGKAMDGNTMISSLKLSQMLVDHALDNRQGESAKKLVEEIVFTIKHMATSENYTDNNIQTGAINTFTAFMKEYAQSIVGHLEKDPTRRNFFQNAKSGDKQQQDAFHRLGEIFQAQRSREMPGGAAVIVTTPANPFKTIGAFFDIAKMAELWKLQLDFYDANFQPGKLNKLILEALDAKKISAMCDVVIGLCDRITEYKRGWEIRQNTQEKAANDIQKTMDLIEKKSDASVRARYVRNAVQAISRIWRVLTTFDNQVISYAINEMRAVLQWCTHSVAYYAESLDAPKAGDSDYRSSSRDVVLK